MRLAATLAAALFAAVLVPSLAAQPRNGKTPTRQVYVSAVDNHGAPVTDLAPADFDVTEAGIKRDVVRAVLVAKTPMRIALMVDSGDAMSPALNHLRAGMLALADAVGTDHELMIVTLGRQVRVRLAPTTDRKKFKDSASGMFMDGGATVLSDGLMEIDDRFMRKADDRWPVFVIVTADGTEGSSGANEKKFNEWIRALPGRGVSVHGVVIKYKGGGMPEIIASHVAETTSGYYDYANTSNSLPDKLKTLGEKIASDFHTAGAKYEVTFTSPMPPGSPVAVGVLRPGLKFESSQTRLR